MYLEMGALSVIVNKHGKTYLNLCGYLSFRMVVFKMYLCVLCLVKCVTSGAKQTRI